MSLSTVGYTASGAGTLATNGNYVPVTGGSATWNGATQYTYGIYFLSFVIAPGPSYTWVIANAANTSYNASQILYSVASTAAGTTNMPLTGWVLIGAGAAAPAPTVAVMAPLSTVGYTASGASNAGVNGNYVPVTGANATFNGATQYTNGPYFLAFSGSWYVDSAPNAAVLPEYYNGGGTAATFPLTGWTASASVAPVPTFAAMSGGGGGATVVRRPPIFF